MAKKSSGSKGTSKRSSAAEGTEPEGEERTFDERLEDLEGIAAQLEGGELGLEQALQEYRRGVQMLRSCRAELQGVREQVEELSAQEGGPASPYEDDPDGPYEQ